MAVKVSQGNILENSKKRLKKIVKNDWLKNFIKSFLNAGIKFISAVKKMSFPKKYGWDWRLEMLLEKYEPETTTLVKKILKPGMKVIDAGAHIGYYSRIFSKAVGKEGFIWAFEPGEENLRILKKNLNSASFLKNLEESFGFSIYAIKTGGVLERVVFDNAKLNDLTQEKGSINLFLKKDD